MRDFPFSSSLRGFVAGRLAVRRPVGPASPPVVAGAAAVLAAACVGPASFFSDFDVRSSAGSRFSVVAEGGTSRRDGRPAPRSRPAAAPRRRLPPPAFRPRARSRCQRRAPTSSSVLLASTSASCWSTDSTGARHWNASSAPRHRRDRRPAVGDDAVGGPGRIARSIDGARQPFAHAALVAVLLALDARHERGDALRQAVVQQRLERGARLVILARLDRGDSRPRSGPRRSWG